MKLPMLFARTNTGAIQTWTIEVDGNKYRTHYGQLDSDKIQITEWTLCDGKNTGKKNATSAEDQAVKEAKATWKKKKESGYFENINDIDGIGFTEPMLAKNYDDYKDDLKYPVYSQPKLDGCLSSDTLVSTDIGELTIGNIVNSNVNCLVKTYNELTKKIEFKPIVNRFKNGLDVNETNKTQWFELTLYNGKTIKITGNHRVYLPRLKCWRRVDELNQNDVLMLEN